MTFCVVEKQTSLVVRFLVYLSPFSGFECCHMFMYSSFLKSEPTFSPLLMTISFLQKYTLHDTCLSPYYAGNMYYFLITGIQA